MKNHSQFAVLFTCFSVVAFFNHTCASPFDPECEYPMSKRGNSIACDDWIIRWTWNKWSRHCERFRWDGCPTTPNFFWSRYECKHACVVKILRRGPK